MLDLLSQALPFVEDAVADLAYKKGVVAKLSNRIHTMIEAMDDAPESIISI